MLNLADLELNEGEAATRPSWITPLDESFFGLDPEPFFAKLVEEQVTLVYGGMSLIGAQGYFVPTLGIISFVPEDKTATQYLVIGHPDVPEPDFIYADEHALAQHLSFPNTMVYFFGKGDRTYALENAPRESLKDMARFVLPFIADSDLPEGTDWPQERVFL